MAILLVPGPGGPAPWLRRWQAEIDGAVLVDPVDPVPPDRAGWLALLAAAVQRHPGAILVGHGPGALLIAHLAAERPELPVGAALLVSPVDADADAGPAPAGDPPLPAGLGPLPVRPFAFPSLLVAAGASARDRARVLANLWESALVPSDQPGPAGTDWPAGRVLLARLALLVRSSGPRPPAGREGRTAA